MTKIFFLIFVVSLSLLYSCHGNKNKNTISIDSLKINIADDSNNIQENKQNVQVSKSKLIVKDSCMIFFMPESKDRSDLIQFYGDYDSYYFQSIFNSFVEQYYKIKALLNNSRVKVSLSYSKEFDFPLSDKDTFVYNLQAENQFMGYILFDGINQPFIRNGLQRAADISNDIRNYFNFKNFTFINPDEADSTKNNKSNYDGN